MEISKIRHSCKYALLRHLTGSDSLIYGHTLPLLALLGWSALYRLQPLIFKSSLLDAVDESR